MWVQNRDKFMRNSNYKVVSGCNFKTIYYAINFTDFFEKIISLPDKKIQS